MISENLPSALENDDLAILIEKLKVGLTSRATGGDYDDEEYKRIRKLILANPMLDKIVPKFLKICRSTDEFWGWIKSQSSTYQDRRLLLAESINPLIEVVEYETGEGALEFKKNYEEKELIGNGGFGMVYKYEHRLLKLPFAVKIFAPAFYDGKSGEKELERFFQEARILFSLNHPNIIRIFDAGLIGNKPFIRMEFFGGKNLNELLLQHGTFTPEQTVIAMKNIVDAVGYAHEKGIIHRDLKPSNIMAMKPNQFRVIDFGLGIFIENELHSRLTKTGSQTISGYYNAPELVSNPKLIDVRSDIYSLGAIWFTLLTGQPPAGSNFISELQAMGIEEKIVNIIKKCLHPLQLRYNSCNELLIDIQLIN